MHGTSHPHHRKLERFLGLLLVISTIGAYWVLLRCDFVFFDDPSYVTENPQVRAGLDRASSLGLHDLPFLQLASVNLALAHARL